MMPCHRPNVQEMFPTLVYSKVKGLKVGKGALECVVCLSKFEDNEKLHLLSRYNHVFYFYCIDTQLTSHVTYLVYRTNLAEQTVDENIDLLHVATLATNMVDLQLKTVAPP